MRVLNILSTGGIGGIEELCKNISKYSKFENYYAFIFDGGQIADEMKAVRNNVYILNSTKYSLKTVRRLIQLCRELKIEIVNIHHNNMFLQWYWLQLKKYYKKGKYVFTIHSCFEKKYNLSHKYKFINFLRYRYIEKSLFSADKVIAVSENGAKSYLEEFFISDEKISVVHNGISLEKIRNAEDNRISIDDKFIILYIGRLEKIKGVDILIEAISKLKTIDCQLIIVGDGSERKNYELLASKLGINSRVTFEGFKRNLDDYLSKANLFVYPSVWQEIFGISIVEAMAYGLPCIANRVGGIPEIIKSGENGFLTDEPSSENIAQLIEMVVERYNSKTIFNISEEAKKTAKRFSILNTVENLKKVYDQLLSS